MENAQAKPRFVSLKLKWALGTAIGSLLISLVVVTALFGSFTRDLLSQERQALRTSITTTQRQLAQLPTTNLTTRQVQQVVKKGVDLRPDQGTGVAYRRPTLQGIASGKLAVTIYNRQGTALFTTGSRAKAFKKVTSLTVSQVKGKQHAILVGRAPIRQASNHRIIGYLQVENHLTSYYQRYQRLLLISGLALTLVVLASGLLGYGLSYFILRPLDSIQETIEAIRDDPTKNERVPVLKRNDELGELSALFNEMLDRMQRYIDQQSQFVGDVSHELRTPVAIIQGHMQLLQRWGKDDPKVLDESLAAVVAETNRMNSLVQEMLDLSRAEQVEVNYHDATTPVREVVHQVYNNFQMIHPDFHFVLDDDLRKDETVKIYRDHLEQILIILCDNAVKYSKEQKQIHLSLSRNLRAVEIGVQDFGEGISAEELAKVFDRFYRVDKARSRKRGGNGLGLAIAKRLVEGYHGTITVESQLGSGSLFRITLPIVEEVAAQPPAPEKKRRLRKKERNKNKDKDKDK